jgi:3-oxoacyl-[acyl-carrier protein] reductase
VIGVEAAATLGFRDIQVGTVFQCDRVFTEDDLDRFATLSGDFSPLHMDEAYATATQFGGRVVHGMLLASLFSQLVGMRIPGRHALYLGQDLSFRLPVRIGEAVRALAKVTAKVEATRTIVLATEIRNADGKVAVSGSAKVKVRDAEAVAPPAASAIATGPTARPTRQKVALVTGASRGIGAAVVQALAARGIAVAVNYFRSGDRAEQLVASIQETGGQAAAVRADVREQVESRRLVDTVVDRFGGLDMVVNGATGPLQPRPVAELDWSAFEEHLVYQVKAVMEVCQAAFPHMKAGGGGGIVNVVSQVASGSPPANMADYVAAKYALKGLSRALAVEWAGDNIRVNTVSPGLVQTELTEHYPEMAFRAEVARTPLKRLARPADVAGAVVYLLGDDATFLTGVDVAVTGGQVMT